MNLLDERVHERILAKKRQLDSHRPLSKEVVSRLQEKMEIEYTYNSNAIEGNTLTQRETQMVIRQGLTVGGKSLSEHLEARNHPKAIEYIENLATQGHAEKILKEADIQKIHELIFSGVLENAGNYRNCQVYIEGCDEMPPPAFEVHRLMKELVAWLNTNPEELRPIELASVFHHKLVSIHPFEDGNGRVCRLVANVILISHGYPLTTIRTVDRKKYYSSLQEADKGNLKPFVNFIARCLEQSLDIYLSAVEPSTKGNQFLSLAQASKLSPYSAQYLGLLARRGLIGATKMGRNWFITPNALMEYVRAHRKRKRTEDSDTSQATQRNCNAVR